MAAIASFSVATKTNNANRLADPENLYTRFQGNYEKKKIKLKKKI